MDKVGIDGVVAELEEKGYDDQQRHAIRNWLDAREMGQSEDWLEWLARNLHAPDCRQLRIFAKFIVSCEGEWRYDKLRIDPSLARGLGYYTGAIMEINVKDLPGSLGAGGRYDNLVGMFLGTEVPACGFSLGLERILVVMQERAMFPAHVDQSSVDVVVAALDESAQGAVMEMATDLRATGDLRVDLYPDVVKKMDRIFKYVDQRRANSSRFSAAMNSPMEP